VTEPLKTHLYYSHNKEGVTLAVLDLSPEKGEDITSFGCNASESESYGFVWRHSVIGAFEKVNEERTSNHLILKGVIIKEEVKQEPEKYETLTSKCGGLEATTDHLEEQRNLGAWEIYCFGSP